MEENSLLAVVRDLVQQITRDGFKLKTVRADREIFKYPKVVQFFVSKGIKIEPSPANT